MRRFIALAALALTSSAYAQSATQCATIGNVTNCQHQPATANPYNYSSALGVAHPENFETQRLKRAEADAIETRTRAEQERLACRKKAMKAIDAGEYDKAKALAALCP